MLGILKQKVYVDDPLHDREIVKAQILASMVQINELQTLPSNPVDVSNAEINLISNRQTDTHY